jgi:hypothetical protein
LPHRDRARLFRAHRQQRAAGAFLLFSLAAAMSGVRLIELTFVGRQPQIIEHFLAAIVVDPAFFNRVGGGMALNTAVILFFSNLSLALTPPEQKGKARIFEELVGYVVSGLGIAALAGYAMHAEHIYRWGNNIGMAVHTAVGVLMLGSAMLVRSWWLQPAHYGGMPVWLPAAICLVGLLVDLYTPLGVANGMIYVPLILTSLVVQQPDSALQPGFRLLDPDPARFSGDRPAWRRLWIRGNEPGDHSGHALAGGGVRVLPSSARATVSTPSASASTR